MILLDYFGAGRFKLTLLSVTATVEILVRNSFLVQLAGMTEALDNLYPVLLSW